MGTAIVWVYPLAQTFSSLKKQEHTPQWLAYWLVIGLVTFLEQTLLSFLAGYEISRICIFQTIKAVFALWLVHPDFKVRDRKGAEYLNEKFFEKIYDQVKAILGPTPVGKFLDLEDSKFSS